MADTITIAGIQFPVATDSAWKLLNPVLKEGEQVFVKDTDASTDYKIKIGDGKTKYADLKFAVDLVEARQLQTQTATKATLATTEANRSKTEADRAKSIADSVGYYTKGESDLKYSPSDLATAEGELLDLCTAEGTMGLEILGKTIVTPTDATQPISPDNVAVIESVGESGDMKFLSCQENIWNMEFAITNDAVKVISPTTLQLNCWANQAYAPSAIKASFKPATKYFIKYKIIMVGQMSDPMQVAYSSYIMFLEERDSNNKIIGSVPLIPDIASWLKKAKEGDSLEKTGTFITTKTLDNPLLFTYSGILNSAQPKPKPTINVEFEIVPYKEELNISEYKGFVGTTAIIPLKDTTGNALEPLRSLPDGTADRLVDIEGVWNLERNVGKVIFKGAEGWHNYHNNSETVSFNTILDTAENTTASPYNIIANSFRCTHLQYSDVEGAMQGTIQNGKILYLGVKKSRLSTPDIAGFKTWLANNPTTVIYKLATPTYTPLHPDTQTLLNNLQKSYAGTTILYGTDPISPTLKATYARPILEVIDRQIERKKLSNAIIRKAEGDILNMPTAESSMDLEILGNTVVTTRVLTFTTNSITTNGADFKFVIGDVITVAGCTTVANNKTATVVTVSADKKVLTFAPSTFTASVESGASLSTAINTDLPISPDNVAVIESVGELRDFGIVRTDGNLFGKGLNSGNLILQNTGESTSIKNTDGYATFNPVAGGACQANIPNGALHIKPKTTYTLLVDVAVNTLISSFFVMGTPQSLSSNWCNTIPVIQSKKTGRFKFVLQSKSVFTSNEFLLHVARYGSGIEEGSIKLRVMLFEGDADIATPYQEGAVMPVSIPLKDTTGNLLEPLRSLPDGTADRLVDIEGVWNVERNINLGRKIQLTERIPGKIGATHDYTYCYIVGMPRHLKSDCVVSNKLTVIKEGETNYNKDSAIIISPRGAIGIGISLPRYLTKIIDGDNDATKQTKFVNAFNGAGFTLQYVTRTPTYTPLHPDTQTILNNLQKTYAGTTVLYGTDPVAPSFKATYTADINQVITELQNAIIALGGTNV